MSTTSSVIPLIVARQGNSSRLGHFQLVAPTSEGKKLQHYQLFRQPHPQHLHHPSPSSCVEGLRAGALCAPLTAGPAGGGGGG